MNDSPCPICGYDHPPEFSGFGVCLANTWPAPAPHPACETRSEALLRAMVEAARAVPSPAPLGDRAAMLEWIRLSNRVYAKQKALGQYLAEGDMSRLCELEHAVEALSEDDQRLIVGHLWRPVQPPEAR